jgi:hypothetical protein
MLMSSVSVSVLFLCCCSFRARSITSFGDRTNDYETVVNYFRAHFNQVHRKTNEKKRVLYSHLTSVVARSLAFSSAVLATNACSL